MAVVGIAEERPGSPVASFECGKHIITRKFRVSTDSVLDGPITVVLALGLPKLFDPYVFGAEFHPYCRCRSVEPERMAPASLDWEVTCRYETPEMKDGSLGDGGNDSESGAESGSGDGGGTGEEKDEQFENPLAAIPEIETHWETKQQPIYGCQGLGVTVPVSLNSDEILTPQTNFFSVGDPVMLYNSMGTVLNATVTAITTLTSITLSANWTGISGNAVLVDLAFHPLRNSAGEIFVPPPSMNVSSLILSITRNEDINSPALLTSASYMNTVNADQFFGFLPGMVYCQSITCQRQNRQLPDATIFPFLRVTYIFHVKQTWDIQLLDKGSYYQFRKTALDPFNPIKFMTADNQLRDGLLDGSGQKLADNAAPVFLTVRPYSWVPFAPLNLPQSFAQVQ